MAKKVSPAATVWLRGRPAAGGAAVAVSRRVGAGGRAAVVSRRATTGRVVAVSRRVVVVVARRVGVGGRDAAVSRRAGGVPPAARWLARAVSRGEVRPGSSSHTTSADAGRGAVCPLAATEKGP